MVYGLLECFTNPRQPVHEGRQHYGPGSPVCHQALIGAGCFFCQQHHEVDQRTDQRDTYQRSHKESSNGVAATTQSPHVPIQGPAGVGDDCSP